MRNTAAPPRSNSALRIVFPVSFQTPTFASTTNRSMRGGIASMRTRRKPTAFNTPEFHCARIRRIVTQRNPPALRSIKGLNRARPKRIIPALLVDVVRSSWRPPGPLNSRPRMRAFTEKHMAGFNSLGEA